MGEVQEQYGVGQWRPVSGGQAYAFPVVSVSEGGGNRIIRRERAYRQGCKLDDTGSKEIVWMIDAVFENSIQEPGTEAINGDLVLYPEVLNELIDSFRLYHDEAGDLYVPTVGWVRARLQDYDRKEGPDEGQDTATLTMVFVSDNEDKIDAGAFTRPSVNANAIRLSQETTFDEQSEGIWNDDSQTLQEFAAGLESWANSPDDSEQELESRVRVVRGAAKRVRNAYSKPIKRVTGSGSTAPGKSAQMGAAKAGGRNSRDALVDPEGATVNIKLHRIEGMAARSKVESRRGRQPLVTVVFERPQSLATVAAVFGQTIDSLIAANPQLEDLLYIPPRTPIRVYDKAA